MNKPLIDGKKLDQSPSFVGPTISPKGSTTLNGQKGMNGTFDNSLSSGMMI